LADLSDRWLSVEEICSYLGVSGDTIYRWIDRSNMPACRVGRLWKFKKEQVDKWVEKGGASTDSSSGDMEKDLHK
jgi:excisionase family DNA binding protein